VMGNLLAYICVPKTVITDIVLTVLLQKSNGAVFCLTWYCLSVNQLLAARMFTNVKFLFLF